MPTQYMPSDTIERKAESILQEHRLAVPVNPVSLAESLGLRVFNATFASDSTSGILRREGEGFEILVNRDHSPYRKRFTVAHELGHYVLHCDQHDVFVDPETNMYRSDRSDQDALDDDSRRMEIQANIFAAALLMPRQQVVSAFEQTRDVDELAAKFRVSETAMMYRLNHLGLW